MTLKKMYMKKIELLPFLLNIIWEVITIRQIIETKTIKIKRKRKKLSTLKYEK